MAAVKDIMKSSGLVTVTPSVKIIDAVKKMYEANVGSVLVVDDNGNLLGIFTERDLVRVVATSVSLEERIDKVMTTKLVTAKPDESLAIVASKMIEHGIRHIPVVDDRGKLVGIVSIRDVLRYVIASGSWP